MVVRCDVAFWGTSLGLEVQGSLDLWAERGWVAPLADAAVIPTEVILLPCTFRDLSVARAASLEIDAARALASHCDVVCRLLGIATGRVLVKTTSFVGAPHVRFVATVESERPQPLSPWVQVERPLPRHPDLQWVSERISELPDPSTREQQLSLLAELRRAAAALDRAGSSGVEIAFHEHLAGIEISEPDRIALSWRRVDGRHPTFTLDAFSVDASSGEKLQLPLGGILGREKLVKCGRNKYAALDDDTDKILRSIRDRWQFRTERDLARVLGDPSSVVPEGVSTSRIDLSEYGTRVLGFVPAIRATRAADVRSGGVRWFGEREPDGGPFLRLIIRPDSGEGEPVTLDLDSPAEAQSLREALKAELLKPSPSIIEHKGHRIVPTPALFHQLDVDLDVYVRRQAKGEVEPPLQEPRPSRLGVDLDEERGLEPRHSAATALVPWDRLAELLATGVELKRHQREGLEWLWSHYNAGLTGVLLADEMGLGKTLQVACFLALQRELDIARSRPALVVAPVLLLDNWRDELAHFLVPRAYEPLVVLHAEDLRRYKRQDGSLDVASLGSASVALTNYDTLDRHQLSLLKVDWRAVVLDEAQNIKNPDTFRSRAARALKRDFAVCSTGTPVENGLQDLWTLFDFLSPLDPLGTRKQFQERFEPGGNPAPQEVARALLYPGPSSRLLRRSKDRVLDLQPKTYRVHRAEMTPEQMQLEQQIVSGAAPREVLQALGQLQSLYQHPWLLRSRLFGAADDAVKPDLDAICAASPKLALCLDVLESIRSRGEKALIFSPWVKMQQLLVHAVKLRCGLPRVHIVNGEANQRHLAMAFVREFSRSDGFDVLILSPIAAGAGLNIVAANHVIHYGRWWNPAKEDQATDRAYRIGQTRPVTVHYPLLHHVGNPNGGFDVALHDLVERKRALARDFLSPTADITTGDIGSVLREQRAPTE